MDAVSFAVFTAVTITFALIITFLLKLTAFRYISWAMTIPWWVWVVLITLTMFALQGMGIPVSEGYSAFFEWLSRVLGGV